VEHDRDREAFAERGGDAAKVRHRDGEDDHGVGTLPLDEALEMAPPARCHEPPDRLPRDTIETALLGTVLGASKVTVAPEPGETITQRRVGLAFPGRRRRRRAPPAPPAPT